MIRAVIAIGLSAIAVTVSRQGEPRSITLRAADATLGEPFTSIYAIRELADGRVLVSDNGADNRLVVADLRSGRVRMVGNIGAGPGEYRAAGKLFALSGDSTLFIDSPNRGSWWLLLHRDSIVRNLPPDLPALRAVGGFVHGAGLRGQVLGVRQTGGDKLSNNLTRERLVAVRSDLSDASADTLAALRGSEFRVTQGGTRARPFWAFIQRRGSAPEQALLFPDDWVAFVRLNPYRVEWLTPTGTTIRGPDVPWGAPRADAREKAAALELHKRRFGDKYLKQAEDDPWSDRLAPIRGGNALVASPEGNLLVLRAQWSQAMDTNYDVFDRRGQRIATLTLPDSERVVGFGNRNVYVSARDGDGFYHLRRHPWP